ncbi:EamA family transporter [Candidatus Woesearchaeota archaeon]|nr:EamA family transporter [Candidatus Woesearchaeota archaeon]
MLNLLVLGLIFVSSLLASFGSYNFKIASKKFSLNLLAQLRNKRLFTGMILFFMSTIIYLMALRMQSLSIIYALSSMTYIMVAVISVKLLREKINKNKWIGIALIILGIILITAVV